MAFVAVRLIIVVGFECVPQKYCNVFRQNTILGLVTLREQWIVVKRKEIHLYKCVLDMQRLREDE